MNVVSLTDLVFFQNDCSSMLMNIEVKNDQGTTEFIASVTFLKKSEPNLSKYRRLIF